MFTHSFWKLACVVAAVAFASSTVPAEATVRYARRTTVVAPQSAVHAHNAYRGAHVTARGGATFGPHGVNYHSRHRVHR